MSDPDSYTRLFDTPDSDTYLRLQMDSGLSVKSKPAACRGLANTLFAVPALNAFSSSGMGRVLGDGGCFSQVVDIGVTPEHQGKGIRQKIMRYREQHFPLGSYVNLIADGTARDLYARSGLKLIAPASVGITWHKRPSPSRHTEQRR